MRDLVTTVMEIAGGLLVVAALAVWAYAVALPLALAAGGLGMVAFSWLLTNPDAPTAAARSALAAARAAAARRRALRDVAQSDGGVV